jgi:Rrf2 family iron-sulfur cluster assembly transcriptional regulator
MKMTTKGRYAVTAMLDLALNHDKEPITLSDISQRQGISLSYLEQLFSRLRGQDLVDSTRGPGGGYRLNRPAGAISVAEIISAVDEHSDVIRGRNYRTSLDARTSLTNKLWADLSEQIHDFLDDITLAQVLELRPQDVSKELARQERAARAKRQKTR